MKKQKFYSTLALITLSTAVLTACSSAKNTVPENTFAQSSQTSSSSKDTKPSTSSSSKASSKVSKSTTSSSKELNSTDKQTVTETVGETSQVETTATKTEEATVSSEQVVVNNQAVTEGNQVTVPENQQVVEQTTVIAPSADYSILTGTWRTANGSEIVFNDKGEVISFDGVAQDNWTPNADYAPFNHYGAWLVPYSHSYVAVLPAGVSYDDGYVAQNAVSEDRLISGTGSTDFENDQVYYRVQ